MSSDTINIDDHQSHFGSIEISIPLNSEEDRTPAFLDLGVHRVEGDDDPEGIPADFSLTALSASVRFRNQVSESFTVAPFAGLVRWQSSIDFDLGVEDVHPSSIWGPEIGAIAQYAFTPSIGAFGRARLGWGLGGGAIGHSRRMDLGVDVSPLDFLALRAGWTWWKFVAEQTDEPFLNVPDPDLEFNTSGLLLELGVAF